MGNPGCTNDYSFTDHACSKHQDRRTRKRRRVESRKHTDIRSIVVRNLRFPEDRRSFPMAEFLDTLSSSTLRTDPGLTQERARLPTDLNSPRLQTMLTSSTPGHAMPAKSGTRPPSKRQAKDVLRTCGFCNRPSSTPAPSTKTGCTSRGRDYRSRAAQRKACSVRQGS